MNHLRSKLLLCGLALLLTLTGVDGRMEQRRTHGSFKSNHSVNRPRMHGWGSDPKEMVRRDGQKYVFMHHIVGNTYPYTPDDWEKDIREISAKGVDALALNIGSSEWQVGQVQAAYDAAKSVAPNFKLFLSFDFHELPCDNVQYLIDRTNALKDHPNQFKVNGKTFVSSYEGGCLGNDGWQRIKDGANAYVMPFISGLENNFGNWPALDSWYCWGCAWPQSDHKPAGLVDGDDYYRKQLGSKYATTVSMWMFTHLPSKNFYLPGDNWLINNRWDQLVKSRDELDFIEMVTWNDYGESDYFGPFRGDQPQGTYWAEKFPHTAWFDMSEYYIKAFKTGSYPEITKDVIYYWARPHPANAVATSDGMGKPRGFEMAEDYLWAAVFSTGPATVTLTIGSSTGKFTVKAGTTGLKIPTSAGKISIKMERGGVEIINKREDAFEFVDVPEKYNYNAFVGSATTS